MDYDYRNLRADAIEKYGGKCASCGFSDWRALHFDHVNGGGAAERRLAAGSKQSYLRLILNDIAGKFQLLCSNCNMIKRCEKNEHVSKSANDYILARMRRFQERQKEELVISLC